MTSKTRVASRCLRRLAAKRAAAIKAGLGAKAARLKQRARVLAELMRA